MLLALSHVGYAQLEFDIVGHDMLSPEFHAARREALRNSLPPNSIAVVFANPMQKRSNDIYFDYHQNPNLYYLSGCREPHAMLIISNNPIKLGNLHVNEIMVVQPRDANHEIWDGKRLGAEGALSILKIDHAITGDAFASMHIPWEDFDRILVQFPEEEPLDNPHRRSDLASLVKHFQVKTEPIKSKVNNTDLQGMIGKLREIKMPEEIELVKKACAITCFAHAELMRSTWPGMTEYQAQAIVEFCFAWQGAEKKGFPSICGSGANTCILHYQTNRKAFAKGNLLLTDIGAEYRGYTADVTRTIPVSGTFSTEQRAIYQLVLKAQLKGIESCLPGKKFWDPHTAAFQVITDGLMELGIIIQRKDASKYFMHGTSHYMGLDVHDTGTYGPLAANQIVTVEPGIYIPEGSPCDPKWWNIGVRIEDDILITNGKPVNLSDAVPKEIHEIEALMQESPQLLKISEN